MSVTAKPSYAAIAAKSISKPQPVKSMAKAVPQPQPVKSVGQAVPQPQPVKSTVKAVPQPTPNLFPTHIEIPREFYNMSKDQTFLDIMHNNLIALCEREAFSTNEKKSIILSATVILEKYVDLIGSIKIPSTHTGSTTYTKYQAYLEVLVLTSLMIVIKWYSDRTSYWANDFAKHGPETLLQMNSTRTITNLLVKTERDILQAFNYNIFRYMPTRADEDILEGSPVVKPYTVLTSQPSPSDIPKKTCPALNPWTCECRSCQKALESNLTYAHETLPPIRGMNFDIMRNRIANNCDMMRKNRGDFKKQADFILDLCRLRKGNPDTFWKGFPFNRRTWIENLRATLDVITFTPYILVVKMLTGG